jgi:hypothetical protein
MGVNSEVTKHMFLQGNDDLTSSVSNSASDHPNCSDVRLTSVGFLNSSDTEGLIQRHAINTPHKGPESEVSRVSDSLGLAGSQERCVKSNYCKLPPRQDACEVQNNCLVEYEKPRKLIYKRDNAKLLKGNSHSNDHTESGKSENMKMQKEARLYLVVSCDRAGTNGPTQTATSNADPSDSRNVTSEQLRAKIDGSDNLSDFQKQLLYALLLKYKNNLTKRPGVV